MSESAPALSQDTIKVLSDGHHAKGAEETRSQPQVISESIAMPVTPEVAKSISDEIEFRLQAVLQVSRNTHLLAQEAKKIMLHSHRTKLTTADINYSLQLQDYESLYGYQVGDSLNFVKTKGKGDVYYIEDKELDIQELIAQPLPALPREVAFQMHWLAIEGVQPRVPQNPVINPDLAEKPAEETLDVVENSVVVEPEPSKKGKGKGKGKEKEKDEKDKDDEKENRPLTKHVLSRELQTYYKKVAEAIRSGDADYLEVALNSVSNDPGITQLVPYFVRFVGKEVMTQMQSGRRLMNVMRLVQGLVVNPYLHPEPYLDQAATPPPPTHWQLRRFAARVVALICTKYGVQYQPLRPRITKTYLQTVLDMTKPLTSIYGAIHGIICLGARAVQLALVPNISALAKLVEPKRADSSNKEVSEEASEVWSALAQAAGEFLSAAAHAYEKIDTITQSAGTGVGESVESTPTPATKPEDKMDVDVKPESNAPGSTEAPTPAPSSQPPFKKVKRTSSATTTSLRLVALEELENLPQRYQEFVALFGDALTPHIAHATSVLERVV